MNESNKLNQEFEQDILIDKHLVDDLANYALNQGITLDIISNADNKFYNPELVNFVSDRFGEEIPVITYDRLLDFVTSHQLGSRPLCSSLYNALTNDRTERKNNDGTEFSFMHLDSDDNKLLKVTTYSDLTKKLSDGKIFIKRVSRKSIKLLIDLEPFITST